MKLAVIGGGAIGLLASYYLKKLGHVVTVVTRTKEQKEALLKKGITLHFQGNIENQAVDAALFNGNTYKEHDLWIVTMKQHALHDFFERWQGEMELPEILFLQNGLGHMEKAENLLKTTTLAGSVTHGAMRKSFTEVIHSGQGEMVVGEWSGESKLIKNLQVSTPLFPIAISEDINEVLKRKLLINLVVNPLTALYRVRNGALLNNTSFADVVKDVFIEATNVLDLQEEEEWDNVVRVIHSTAENQSSMLQDMQQGRKTEIDAMTGYALKLAEEKKIHIPIIRFLHRSIVGLERG